MSRHPSTHVLVSAIVVCAALAVIGLVTTAAAHPKTIHEAQHRVDAAWDAFHQAALTGALASPDVQTRVERDLHEARGLLVKARDAAERKDQRTVDTLLHRIEELAARAIKASRQAKP